MILGWNQEGKTSHRPVYVPREGKVEKSVTNLVHMGQSGHCFCMIRNEEGSWPVQLGVSRNKTTETLFSSFGVFTDTQIRHAIDLSYLRN
jgi:hypothetical protein